MSFAPQRPFGSDMMDEINRRVNPLTGKLEPIGGTGYPTLPKPAPGWGHHPTLPKPAPGWGHHPRVKTMEWNYERDGPDPLAGFGPIGPYNPADKSEVVPVAGDFLVGFMQDHKLF